MEGFLNDYALIWTDEDDEAAGEEAPRRVDAKVTDGWFQRESAFIKDAMKVATSSSSTRGGQDDQRRYDQVVVLTHHAPSHDGCSDPRHGKPPLRMECYGFSSDMESLFGPRLALWAFGHTHFNCDFKRGGTRVISNQRGYGWDYDRSGYVMDKVVNVG